MSAITVAAAIASAVTAAGSLGAAAWARHRARALERRCRDMERACEARAWLSELRRHRSITVVAADVAHDLAAPTRYLEDLVKQLARGEPVEAEDVTVGEEEAGRLRRLLTTLRRIEFRGARPARTRLRPAVERALDATVAGWRQDDRVRVEVADDLAVRADDELLPLTLACLIDNAARAGAFGVRAHHGAEALLVDVWDAGGGLPEAVHGLCFRPWANARPGGEGFGLAVAARIVRSFGWQIAHARERGQTFFRIEIPRRDVVNDANGGGRRER